MSSKIYQVIRESGGEQDVFHTYSTKEAADAVADKFNNAQKVFGGTFFGKEYFVEEVVIDEEFVPVYSIWVSTFGFHENAPVFMENACRDVWTVPKDSDLIPAETVCDIGPAAIFAKGADMTEVLETFEKAVAEYNAAIG